MHVDVLYMLFFACVTDLSVTNESCFVLCSYENTQRNKVRSLLSSDVRFRMLNSAQLPPFGRFTKFKRTCCWQSRYCVQYISLKALDVDSVQHTHAHAHIQARGVCRVIICLED